jgi:hypothetical protein
MTSPSITDWISAVTSILGIPIIIWGIIKIFKKDKAQVRKLNALEDLAHTQNEVAIRITEEINELAKQTSEYQYQSSLMEESNNLLGKQIEIQNEIFLTNKVSEQRKLELQEIERQNKIKPHFVFNFAQSDSSSNKITLKNNGATARNVRIEENSNDYIRARILKSGEETENGEKIEIALTKKSDAPGINISIYSLEILYEDIDGRIYKQSVTNNRISIPEKIDTPKLPQNEL